MPHPAPIKRGLATLRPYLSLLRGQELQLALATLLMTISTLISLAIPVAAGHFVDAMNAVGNLTDSLTTRHLTVLAVLLVLQLGGTFCFTVISARLGLHTVTILRRRLFTHMLELPSLYFTDQRAGDLSSRLTSDVGSIQYLLTTGLVSLARALLTLLGALALMYRLNPRLTVFVLLLIPSTILLVRVFGSRLQKLSRLMYDELGRVSSHVQETVSAIRTLKVYNNQNHEEHRFNGMINSYMVAGVRRAWLSAALESGIQISLWICLIAVMVYGFALTARGATTSGELVAFLLLAFRVAIPLASLTNLFASAQGSIAAASRLDDIFAQTTERQPGALVPEPVHTATGITLHNVSFRYPETPHEQTTLHDINLSIKPGQWVGLVGPSGAGKTTLAGLIMGLFPPNAGSLLIDDQPYSDRDLASLRAHMAFVAQDPVLYDMSLADNIRFGLTKASDEKVRQAAAHAGMLEFTDQLPDGLGTQCGENGAKLSGGQRQRVALARAFLRDPGLLILDEPTSALDAAAEQGIQHSLRKLMTGRTAIVIAHRFSLIREMDIILVLSQGEIIESGDHNSLMALKGLYYQLVNMQAGA